MVFTLTLVWSVVICAIVSTGFYFFPDLWPRWLTFLCVSTFMAIFNLTLNSQGHTKLASWSFCIMLWLFITIPCYTAGGILATGIITQVSVILTSAFLLGWRGGLAIGLLTIVADFGFAYLDIISVLPPSLVPHNPLTRWVVTIIPFGTILVLQYYSTIQLRTSLRMLELEIRKRENALEKLGISQERYKSIISISNTGAWEYRVDTNRVWYSAEYFAMIGIERPDGDWEDSLGITWIQALHPDDRERSLKIFNDFIKEESKGLYENYFRLQHQDGDWVWIWSRGRRLLDTNGELTNVFLGTHIDITERIKAEEKTKQSEALIKKITSQVPSNTYMFEIDETGFTTVHFFSRGTEEINHSLDLQDMEKASQKLMTILHDDDKPLWIEKMKEAYHTQSDISFQYRLWLNGQMRWRWFRAIPEKTEDGKVLWYGAAQDISPLVEYITSIEQIIFDIGHVIRRPITTMMGMTKLIMDNDFDKEETKDISEKLHSISEEMDKFIQELNRAYQEKRQETKFKIDVSASIDKRDSLFQ